MAGLGSLFAPAYQAGSQPSLDAVNAWMANNFSMTAPKVEATRRPVAFNTGNPAGMVDPEALRVLAQGGPYDANARRNEIAAAVAAAAAATPVVAAATPVAAGSVPVAKPYEPWVNAS